MSKTDDKLALGLFIHKPAENRPEYVRATLSIDKDQFLPWLERQDKDKNGYVRIDILRSEGGKLYGKLDNWKPDEDVAF